MFKFQLGSIKARLTYLLFFSVTILILTCLVGNLGLIHSRDTIGTQIDQAIDLSCSISEVNRLMLQHRRYEKDYFLNIGNPDKQKNYLDQFTDQSGSMLARLDELNHLTSQNTHIDSESLAKIQGLKTEFQNYSKGFVQLAQTLSQDPNINPQQANKMMTPIKDSIHALETDIEALYHTSRSRLTSVMETGCRENASWASRQWAIGLTGLGLFLTAFIIFFVWQMRAIGALSHRLQAFASGQCDLTRRVAITGKNELSEIAGYFNQFIEQVHQIISSIANDCARLTLVATEQASSSTCIIYDTEKNTDRLTSTAAATEELSVSMANMTTIAREVVENMRNMSQAIEAIMLGSQSAASNTQHVGKLVHQAVELSQSGSQDIKQLDDAAQTIGNVVDMIQDIADKTNLLALNATIEAARAGEAGKGFAIVANEVKELARQSADATQEIQKQIQAVQNMTARSIDSIHQASQSIQQTGQSYSEISRAIEDQGQMTNEMAQRVTHTTDATQNFNSQIDQIAIAADEISKNMARLEQANRETSKGAHDIFNSGDQLVTTVQGLLRQVDQFTIQRSGIDILGIKAGHSMWKKRLADMLHGKSELKSSEIADHHQCAFGHWYDNEGTAQFGPLEVFRQLGSVHCQIHDKARQIAQLIENKNINQAYEEYHQFQILTDSLFEHLDRLNEQIESSPLESCQAR